MTVNYLSYNCYIPQSSEGKMAINQKINKALMEGDLNWNYPERQQLPVSIVEKRDFGQKESVKKMKQENTMYND